MLRCTVIFAFVLSMTSPAFATGGFDCTTDDENLQFAASSPLGRGMGAPIINLMAAGQIKLKDAPADLAKLEFSKSLVHSWMLHPDVKLHFYSERGNDKPHGYVELIITAVAKDDEGTAEGEYQLTVFSTEPPADTTEGAYLKATGKVSCFVEYSGEIFRSE